MVEATPAACTDDQQVGGSAELDEHLDRVPGPKLHLHVPRPRLPGEGLVDLGLERVCGAPSERRAHTSKGKKMTCID
jgi:hypothetical protein